MSHATKAGSHPDFYALDPIPYLQGLHEVVPWERLVYILTQTGRASKRNRRLPAPSVAWLVMAMSLWAGLSIPQVWRRLHPTEEDAEPTESAFAQARQRLGVAALVSPDGAPNGHAPNPWSFLPRLATDGTGWHGSGSA